MRLREEILEVIERIYSVKRVIIYGAKEKGKNMLSVCLNIGWNGQVEVVVTKLEKKLQIDSLIGRVEVKEINHIKMDKDTLIFVCMQENYYSEVTEVLINLGVDIQNILYPNADLILELKKYAIFYRFKSINLDLNLLKGFSLDDVVSLFYLWESGEDWHLRSIKEKMWEIANETTAKYVIQNMLTVEYFKSREKYLEMLSQSYLNGDGLKLEFGVAGGASIWKFAQNVKDKIYGFDSFEGLQEKFAATVEVGCFRQEVLPNVPDNVELVKGYYVDTLPDFLIRKDVIDKTVEFMHIDCDLYSSTKQVFQYLGNKIVKGTVIAFDEYFNYPGWENGEFKAFQEWVKENQVEYEYIAYVESSAQVAVKILNKKEN